MEGAKAESGFPAMRSESPPMAATSLGDEDFGSPRCARSFFPRSLSGPASVKKSSSSSYRRTISEPEMVESAAYYRRMFKAGVPVQALQYRMHLDGVDTNKALVESVFGCAAMAKIVDDDFYANRSQENSRLGLRLLSSSDARPLDPKMSPSWKNTNTETKNLIAKQKATGKSPRHSGVLELLDLKRAGQIVLALREFSDLTRAGLLEAIDCVEQIHGSERVHSLLEEILPTEAECNLIRAYCGSEKELAPCSRWLKQLMDVPDYEAKVKVIQTVELFPLQADEISEQFRLVERVADAMMDSKKLKKLLSFVLSVGRILKKGCNLRNASTFQVDSLSRFSQSYGMDGKMTVMDFMVRCVALKRHGNLNLIGDFPECKSASRVDIPSLLHEMSTMYTALEDCKAELKRLKMDDLATTHWSETEYPLHHGIKRLERFIAYAGIRFSKLEVDCDLALDACRKLSKFCGIVNGNNTTACIGVITQFAIDLERASQEYKAKTKLTSVVDGCAMSSSDNLWGYRIHLMRTQHPALRYQLHHPVAKTARRLMVEVIAMGPKCHEPNIDKAHIRHVKSLVGLYDVMLKSKIESQERQGSNSTFTFKKSDTSSLKNWNQVSQQLHIPSAVDVVDETPLHHVHSLVGLFTASTLDPPLKSPDNVGATYKITDESLQRADFEQMQMDEIKRDKTTRDGCIVEEHIHHVSSLVDVYNELLAATTNRQDKKIN